MKIAKVKSINHPLWGLLVSVVTIILILELSPYLIGKSFLGQPFSRKAILSELQVQDEKQLEDSHTKEADTEGQYLGDHLLHPYFGFTGIPRTGYNRFGFPGEDPLFVSDDNVFNICITGGSVAMQLYRFSKNRMIERLRLEPSLSGKEIQITVLALGGFKQPQQLIALNYFMALGAGYDVVVNLDGFNEIVLPYSDNLPFGVFPSFPRHWNIYSRKSLDQQAVVLLGRQADLKLKQERTRSKLSNSVLRYSNFMLLVWKLSDLNKHNQILIAEASLRKIIEQSGSDFQSTGPSEAIHDTTAFFRDQVLLWAQASRQMNVVTSANDGLYLHFLQPNQYVEGSKPLTQLEMEIAWEEGEFAYKDAVQKGYPLLSGQGKILQDEGVFFFDLTELFVSEKRSVYSDKCCHFNQLGYDIIADYIAREIVKKLNDN